MTWEQFFAWLMAREGRTVTHDPRDPGGQTAWGISRRYHQLWRGWALVDRGIVSGPEFERAVSEFYAGAYKTLWESLPPRVREVLIDGMVNMGPGEAGDKKMGAVEILQVALNRLAGSDYVTVDGDLGSQTMAAVKTVDPSALAFAMCAIRMAEYNRRAIADVSKKVWLSGWIERVRLLMAAI